MKRIFCDFTIVGNNDWLFNQKISLEVNIKMYDFASLLPFSVYIEKQKKYEFDFNQIESTKFSFAKSEKNKVREIVNTW